MQLASHGARVVARNAPHSTRAIHIPSAIRPQATGLGKRLFNQTRLALSRFVTHLTAPGVGTVSVARSVHAAANPSIQQRLSFTARTVLSRPVHPHFVPRGPTLPRMMTQVGLGTARNFSSGRPLFQQLADNVPIAGRAFYEADWDLNMRQEQDKMRRPSKKGDAQKAASKELLKPTQKKRTVVAAPTAEAELEHYFPTEPTSEVTTYLLIPLAPTPSERAPLAEFPAERLPLPTVLSVHDSYAVHSLRVSSLFQRLDTADVWSRGVLCSAYSSTAGPEGVCTVLKVEFVGWSKAAVRGVIGESGTGWCVLEETSRRRGYEMEDDDDDGAFSDTSSILSEMDSSPPSEAAAFGMDPSQWFVLPTLDFSSSFFSAATHVDPFRPGSDIDSGGRWDSESDSDVSSPVFVDPPSENGWYDDESVDPWADTPGLGFSADFARRQAFAA
ncbi:hypothetical protein FB45DRAFT_732083 [Roridomyces roridus]|uniref:Uncharacterized protein n=1 Tax=Roridomyces roridus TaxID=1738132 RepID=A0AAD7FZB4_9AGAR|nr:hypothetical protein FB45DRAFT_732083 [Roridomyces roridus]